MPSLEDLPWLLLALLSKRREISGLQVCAAASDADAVFGRVAEALDLLGHYDPEGKEQLRRDVRRLLFTETPGGNYFAGISTCRIGTEFAKRASALTLCMMIVHEATHARLANGGMRYVGDQRERIERLCVEAEIAFAERVPGSEEAISKARALLETEWWNAERHAETAVTELTGRGVPRWLAKRIVARGLRQLGPDRAVPEGQSASN